MTRNAVRTLAQFCVWAEQAASGLTYAGPDPHHGIGLHHIVPGFRILTIDAPPAMDVLRGQGVCVRSVPGAARPAERTARTTVALVSRPEARDWLARAPALLVFKSAHALEQLCARFGWPLLAAPACVARTWENKAAFQRRAQELGLMTPRGESVDMRTATYPALAKRLGARIVVQAPHGYGGRRTVLVHDAQEWSAGLAVVRSPVARASQYVPGTPVTLNACVLGRGVAVGAPIQQVTGEPLLTPYGLGSCGNEWGCAQLPSLDTRPLVRAAKTIGARLAAEGYAGVFGVDFVLGDDGNAYVIEVNPRLVASIALHTQLEIACGRLPLLARHVLAFMAPACDAAALDVHEAPLTGGQLIAYHVGNGAAEVTASVPTGVYRWPGDMLAGAGASGPQFVGPACSLQEVGEPNDMLLLAPARGRVLLPGVEWARLQVAGQVLEADGRVRPDLLRAVSWLRQATGIAALELESARPTQTTTRCASGPTGPDG